MLSAIKKLSATFWIRKHLCLLGKPSKSSDTNIAELLKISVAEVREKRESLGFSKYRVGRKSKLTDRAIAKKLGIGRGAVAVQRAAMGIPRFDRERKG